MDSASWQLAVQTRLRQLAAQTTQVAPGKLYSTLVSTVLAPVLASYRARDYTPLVTLFGIVGGVAGNLIASHLEAWQNLSEDEFMADLAQKAASEPLWRETFDRLLREFVAPEARNAGISQEQINSVAEVLRQEAAQFGAPVTAGGDAIVGDIKTEGDHSVIAVGANITQNIYSRASEGADPVALRTAYLHRLFNQANTLSLAGIDPKAASDAADARLNLGAVYTALMTTSLETPNDPAIAYKPKGRQQEEQQSSAVAQLNRHARLVLLGDPGSGKSTFVNFVTLCLAGEVLAHPYANLDLLTAPLPDELNAANEAERLPQSQSWQHGALLPVRVVLRDFAARGLPSDGTPATANHLWQFICQELSAAALGEYAVHLRSELMNQGGLILLDGLDEVPDAEHQRNQIKLAVEDFADTFNRCRILVTSRTYAYQHQEWRLTNFVVSALAPFTKGQIASFVDRWYAHIAEIRHIYTDDAQGRAELLKHAIFSNDRLRALAERPLLLTLTASLHAWRGGSLPDRREELYADAVDLLLDWWESQRIARDAQGNTILIQPSLSEWLRVDRARVRSMLNAIAFEAHASQPTLIGTADISESALVTRLLDINENEDVKPRLLVAYLSQRAGLLLPRGVKNYTFPHRTFQEYLAACYLTDIDYPDTLAELTRQEPMRWREVTLLAGAKAARGTSSAIWSLVDALCFREPDDPEFGAADLWGAHLAGQTLVEAVNLHQVSPRHQRKVERVQRGLAQALQRPELPALERAQAGRCLARLGDIRREVMTLEQMAFCFVPAGPFLMGDSAEVYEVGYPYWIARYPLTNAQFQAFVAADGYAQDKYWPEAARAGFWQPQGFKGRYDSKARREPRKFEEPFSLPNHPLVGISWYEALAFTRWMTDHLRQQGILPPPWSVRLPNEPEWEKAARGGIEIPSQPVMRPLQSIADVANALGAAGDLTSLFSVADRESITLVRNTLPARLFAWGDEANPECANYERTEIRSTSAVGCFPQSASPYGAEEMNGNVWEWTRSLFQPTAYPADPPAITQRENITAHAESQRVVRGGAFYYYEYFMRCAERFHCSPDELGKLYGLRLVLVP